MSEASRPVLVLHADPELRARIRAATAGGYMVQEAADWTALRTALRDAPPSPLVVVDPYHGSGALLAPDLLHLLVDFPSTPVVATLKLDPDTTADLFTLRDWGVTEVITLTHDDTPNALRARLRGAQGLPLKVLLDSLLPHDLPAQARNIIDTAADVVATRGGLQDLAAHLGISERTLRRWCEAGGLPPARKLLTWMRLLLAAELLDDPGRTAIEVAHACGYSTGTTFWKAMHAFAGAGPTTLREQGAFAWASRAFLARLAKYRRRAGP
jgi:AraC-like DNA-binding protein